MDKENFTYKMDVLNENSADIYLYKNRVRTNIIYIITLAAISITIIMLPFIYVDIMVNAPGSIRPVMEKTIVTASITEIVDSVYVREGQMLRKGDLILTQRAEKNKNQQNYRLGLIRALDAKIGDLRQLALGHIPSHFSSMEILEEYNHYLSQRQQLLTNLEQSQIEWERNKVLFDAGLISESEYNNYYYQYTGKKNELATLDRNQKSIWQGTLYSLRKERKEYSSSDEDLKSERLLYELRSPVSGFLDQFSGIYRGSSISAGQKIAVISPNTDLCLEVYVAPRDIAFIKCGQDVKIQIDALNYNEWGTIHGIVSAISSDMTDDGNGNYYYRVKCKMDKGYLTLRNTSRKAFVKKGMSAIAHFVVTRQSLFTLIYKNINEWANPTQYNQGI